MEVSMSAKWIGAIAIGVLAMASACSDDADDGGAGGSGNTGASSGTPGASSGNGAEGAGAGSSTGTPASSGSGGDTGSGGTGATGGDGSGGDPGAGGNGALAECKEQAMTNPNPRCADCACDNCLAELQECEADPTCVALRTCAQANDCCDEICVLLNCGDELEAAGGVGGPGTNKVTAVRDCTEAASCNCCE
jgi:hypothetical protein